MWIKQMAEPGLAFSLDQANVNKVTNEAAAVQLALVLCSGLLL